MSKRLFVIACLLSTGLIFAPPIAGFAGAEATATEHPLARNILEKADEIRFPREGFQVDIDITSTTADGDTDKRKYRVLSKGNENTLVMILEPAAERGQIMLMKGRDLWVFLPEVSQPIRLGLAQRLTGQVANGDLARANFSGDYTPRLLRTDRIHGKEQYVLELRAVANWVTYHRVLLWVDKSDYRPRKAEFYSLSDRVMKTCFYEDYRVMAGRIRPTRMVIVDGLNPGDRSVLDYHGMKMRNLPDKIFSKFYLKKLQ